MTQKKNESAREGNARCVGVEGGSGSGDKTKGSDNCLSLRRLQMALNRIIEISIPFHLKAIERHKQLIERYRQKQDWDQLLKEQINGLQSVERLKADLRQLESLAQKAMPCHQQMVCQQIHTIKANVCSVVEQFIETNQNLTNPTNPLIGLDLNCSENHTNGWVDSESEDKLSLSLRQTDSSPTESQPLITNLEIRLKVDDQKNALISWQSLTKELNDLNEMFNSILLTLVGQKERINRIEDNISGAHEDVVIGTQHLSKASALKTTLVPITAGLLGGAVFGPIGMMAGFKFSGIVSAVGAGIIGYSGVKLIQHKSIASEEIELISSEEKKIIEKKNE